MLKHVIISILLFWTLPCLSIHSEEVQNSEEEVLSTQGLFESDNPKLPENSPLEEEMQPKREVYEIRIDPDRSGYDAYYRVGEGFLITNYFGVASSIEIFDEAKKIDDMAIVAGLEAPNFEGSVPDEILGEFIRPVYTKNYVLYTTLKHQELPLRFRYTYTYKDFILKFINKDLLHWDQHNFDLLYGLEFFDRENFLVLNPVYERRYINKTNRDLTVEGSDIFWMNYTIHPTDWFEFFGFVAWEWTSGIENTDADNDEFALRFEPRILIPDWRLRITSGYFRSDSEGSSAAGAVTVGAEKVKEEIYLDLGKDLFEKWRSNLRMEYVTVDLDGIGDIPDAQSDSFRIRSKFTYEIAPWWDFSFGLIYEDDIDFDRFDNYGFSIETEVIRSEIFRMTAGLEWRDYFDLDVEELLFNIRFHLFRDIPIIPTKGVTLHSESSSDSPLKFPTDISSSGETQIILDDKGEKLSSKFFSLPAFEEEEYRLPPVVLSLGGRASHNDSDGFVDVLAPIYGDYSGVLMINPRFMLSENSQYESNIGGVLRKMMFDEHAIVGANVFYDRRESSFGNHFDQLGVGLEVLTEWVDGRANYYLPNDEGDPTVIETSEAVDTEIEIVETAHSTFFKGHELLEGRTKTTTTTTTTHHFDRFERAMEGFDAEVGVKLPFINKIADTRVFGGYYHYDSAYGGNLEGFKARIEVRATPGLILDAEWFEDKELHGSDYYVGARVRVPFELSDLWNSPFAGVKSFFQRKPQPLKARMTDMVIRDVDIILEESDFIEDLDLLNIDEVIDVVDFNITLLEDITHVNGNNLDFEDGTFENPFDTIQEGVDDAFGNRYVFVEVAPQYTENVVLRENVKLWGSGHRIRGAGSGFHPEVDGQSKGPTITMADGAEVFGLKIVNTNLGGPAQFVNIKGTPVDISRVGIYGNNSTNIKVHHNILQANSTAVLLNSDGLTNFKAQVYNNLISFNDNGIQFIGQGSGGGNFETWVYDNTISNNGVGLAYNAMGFNTLSTEIRGNTITGNSQGINIMATTAGNQTVLVHQNTLDDNTGVNLEMTLTTTSGVIDVDILDNEANRSTNLLGILIDTNVTGSSGGIDILVSDNNASDNQVENIKVDASTGGAPIDITLQNNDFSDSVTNNGVVIIANTTGSGNITAKVLNNDASGNDDFNILTNLDSVNGDINVNVSNNLASNSSLLGISVEGTAVGSGNVNATVNSNTANNNENENIKVDLDTNTGSIDVDILSNQASSSTASNGIQLASTVSSGAGTIDATISNNTANSNFNDNISAKLDTSSGDLTVVIDSNQASSASAAGADGIFLDADVATGIGNINATISNNTANSNSQVGVLAFLNTVQGDITAVINNNQISSHISEANSAGIVMFGVTTGVGGDINTTISNNVANGNNASNIAPSLNAVDGDITATIQGNQASNSTTGFGVTIVSDIVSGTGNMNVLVDNNVANANEAENIDIDLSTDQGSIMATVTNNQTSNSNTTNGIIMDVDTAGGGAINVDVSNNTANSNQSQNIDLDLDSTSNDVTVTVSNNQVSTSVAGLGLLLRATANVSGAVIAVVDNNTVNNNDAANNIELDLDSTSANLNLIFSNNQLSNSDVGSGAVINTNANTSGNIDVTISANTAGGNAGAGIILNSTADAGSINVDVQNNINNGNTGNNFELGLNSNNGDVTVTVMGNQGSTSGSAVGLTLTGNVASGTGAVVAVISNNTFSSNNGTNIFLNLDSRGDNLNLTMDTNTANSSTAGLGIFVDADVIGAGNLSTTITGNAANSNSSLGMDLQFAAANGAVNANVINNTASSNQNENLKVTLNATSSDVTGTFSGNVTDTSTASHGLFIDADTNNGNINLDISNNQANGNNTFGFLFDADVITGGSITADIDNNTAIANGFIGMIMQGWNSVVDTTINLTNNCVTNTTTAHGIELTVTAGGDVDLMGQGNNLRENGDDEIRVNITATGTPTIDFGSGTLGSTGQNAFVDEPPTAGGGNGFEFNDVSPAGATITAEDNFWTESGAAGINQGDEFNSNNNPFTVTTTITDPGGC